MLKKINISYKTHAEKKSNTHEYTSLDKQNNMRYRECVYIFGRVLRVGFIHNTNLTNMWWLVSVEQYCQRYI